MKASNLGVVFSTTLMCPEQESVASIMDIKYQNIVIEMMISEMEKVIVCVCVYGGGGGGGGDYRNESKENKYCLTLWSSCRANYWG